MSWTLDQAAPKLDAGATAATLDGWSPAADTTAPTVTVNIVDSVLSFADSISAVNFTFSEAPVGFTAADVTATGGTVSGFAATGNSLVYTATFTATANFVGTGSVSVTGSSYTDAAGNLGSGGSDTVAIDTSPPPPPGTFIWIPSYNSQLDEEPRVLSAAFGDGYEQRVGDGVNKDLPKWSVRFDVRTVAEATAIRDFLKLRGGATSFNWTPPMGAAGKFLCRKWSANASAALTYNLSAVFEQVPE